MGALFGGIGVFCALLAAALVAMVIFVAFGMWAGARVAGVRKPTFGKALVASLCVAVVSAVLTAGVKTAPWTVSLSMSVLSLIASLLIIKGIYKTTFPRAVVAWSMAVIFQFGALVLLGMTTVGAVAAAVIIAGAKPH